MVELNMHEDSSFIMCINKCYQSQISLEKCSKRFIIITIDQTDPLRASLQYIKNILEV